MNGQDGTPPLPDRWVWTTIGEIAETTSGGTPSRKRPEYYIDGSIPWIKSGELRDGIISEVEESITDEALSNSSAKIFPKGTPVVALYGATVGRTGILGIDAATNQAVCAMFTLENAFIPKFIIHWLQQQRANLIGLSSGGAQPNISQRITRAFPFPLAPLAEQHRIVAEIETHFTRLDAGVAALKRAQANLRRYKASVLKAACKGRLVLTEATLACAEGRDYEPADQLLARILVERRARWEAEHPGKRYKEPVPPDMEDLPELPEGWVRTTLEHCVDILDSRRVPVNAKEREARISGKPLSELYPYFGATGQVGWINDYLFDDELVLLGEDGAPFLQAFRDKAYTIRGKSWVNNHAHVLRAIAGLMLNSYLCHYLNVSDYRDYVTGTTRLKLNQSRMRRIPIPLPPFAEQRRIVAEVERRLSVVAALEASAGAALARARRLAAGRAQAGVRGPAGAAGPRGRASVGAVGAHQGREGPARGEEKG